MSWIQKDIIEPLQSCKEKVYGRTDDWFFDSAIYKSIRIMKLIDKYIEKHGEASLSDASKWLYQDDKGQREAVDLVANILEELSEYADDEHED